MDGARRQLWLPTLSRVHNEVKQRSYLRGPKLRKSKGGGERNILLRSTQKFLPHRMFYRLDISRTQFGFTGPSISFTKILVDYSILDGAAHSRVEASGAGNELSVSPPVR